MEAETAQNTSKNSPAPFQYVFLNSYYATPLIILPFSKNQIPQQSRKKRIQSFDTNFLIKKTQTNKKKFTSDEDSKIIELVGNEKFPCWQNISSQIPGKTARQCRERYQHYLSPNISNDPWTEKDEKLLELLQKQYGNNWAKLTEYFKGRTNTFLKNKWNSLHRKQETNKSSVSNQAVVI